MEVPRPPVRSGDQHNTSPDWRTLSSTDLIGTEDRRESNGRPAERFPDVGGALDGERDAIALTSMADWNPVPDWTRPLGSSRSMAARNARSARPPSTHPHNRHSGPGPSRSGFPGQLRTAVTRGS